MNARHYVCPDCGYDGLVLHNITGTIDFNFQPGCPRCATVEGKVVWLMETTDPRGDELPAAGTP